MHGGGKALRRGMGYDKMSGGSEFADLIIWEMYFYIWAGKQIVAVSE